VLQWDAPNLRLGKETAVVAAVTSNVAERRSSEPFYVNIPSSGLKGQLCNDAVTGGRKANSRSGDSVTEDDSFELVITEPDDHTQLSDSQKCNCCFL